ncbi:MAG: hypothetical protein AAF561_03355 [Planctomycetota bacterium]
MADASDATLVLVGIAGLSYDDVGGSSSNEADSPIARLHIADPPVAATLFATLVTGLPAWRHWIGSDDVWEPLLYAPRPASIPTATAWSDVSSAVTARATDSLTPDDLGDDALADIAGDDLVRRLRIGNLAERRTALGAAEHLAKVVSLHAAATNVLDRDRPPLLFVAYDLGPILRAGGDCERLGRFAAMMIGRLRQLGGRLIVAGARCQTAAHWATHATAPAGTSDGFLLTRGVPAPAETQAIDVAPTVRQLLALPPRADLPGKSWVPAEVEVPVFPSTKPETSVEHPEAESIAFLTSRGLREPVVRRDGETRQRLHDHAAVVLAASALADGRSDVATRWIDTVADRLDTLPTRTVAAMAAFRSGDEAALASQVQAIAAAGHDTPLLRAASALTTARDGDAEAAATLLDQIDDPLLAATAADLAGLPQARSLYERCLPHPDAAAALARLHAAAGEHEAAIEHALTVVEARPQDGHAHATLARCLAGAGDTDNARLAFEHSLRWRPGDVPTRRRLARLLRQLGDEHAAVLHEQEALKQEASSAERASAS